MCAGEEISKVLIVGLLGIHQKCFKVRILQSQAQFQSPFFVLIGTRSINPQDFLIVLKDVSQIGIVDKHAIHPVIYGEIITHILDDVLGSSFYGELFRIGFGESSLKVYSVSSKLVRVSWVPLTSLPKVVVLKKLELWSFAKEVPSALNSNM